MYAVVAQFPVEDGMDVFTIVAVSSDIDVLTHIGMAYNGAYSLLYISEIKLGCRIDYDSLPIHKHLKSQGC